MEHTEVLRFNYVLITYQIAAKHDSEQYVGQLCYVESEGLLTVTQIWGWDRVGKQNSFSFSRKQKSKEFIDGNQAWKGGGEHEWVFSGALSSKVCAPRLTMNYFSTEYWMFTCLYPSEVYHPAQGGATPRLCSAGGDMCLRLQPGLGARGQAICLAPPSTVQRIKVGQSQVRSHFFYSAVTLSEQ